MGICALRLRIDLPPPPQTRVQRPVKGIVHIQPQVARLLDTVVPIFVFGQGGAQPAALQYSDVPLRVRDSRLFLYYMEIFRLNIEAMCFPLLAAGLKTKSVTIIFDNLVATSSFISPFKR